MHSYSVSFTSDSGHIQYGSGFLTLEEGKYTLSFHGGDFAGCAYTGSYTTDIREGLLTHQLSASVFGPCRIAPTLLVVRPHSMMGLMECHFRDLPHNGMLVAKPLSISIPV